MNKTLIIFFSHKGETYFPTGYQMLDKGNAQIIAETAQNILGKNNTEIREIKTVHEYPQEYGYCCEMAEREQELNIFPALQDYIDDIANYQKIVLVFPCWYGTMPRAVFSLLKKHDLTNKDIYPICTHEGSGMGSSERDLKETCPSANIHPGLAIRGHLANTCEQDLRTYLTKNK